MKICETCKAAYEGALDRCPLDRGRLVEAADPLLGRRVREAYRIIAPIGRGSLATVYRARHELVGRDVAIKVLSPAVSKSPTLRERFLREARAANRIRHPHVIDIADIGETEDGLAFLVMELLDGRTLAQEIAGGALAPGRALAIAAQAASALGCAHEIGVIHRDVKPANIILLRRGSDASYAKLLDFGLANVRGEDRLTASGMLLGTPAYMAPEQIEGALPTAAVDLYALGCVLFEMLTGSLPFQGSTQVTLDLHLSEPPPRPSERRPGLPPEIDRLVLALLEKSPERRLDARTCEGAIRQLLAPSAEEDGPYTTRSLHWEQIGAFADRIRSMLERRDEIGGAGAARRRELVRSLDGDLGDLLRAGPALIDALRVAKADLDEEEAGAGS